MYKSMTQSKCELLNVIMSLTLTSHFLWQAIRHTETKISKKKTKLLLKSIKKILSKHYEKRKYRDTKRLSWRYEKVHSDPTVFALRLKLAG